MGGPIFNRPVRGEDDGLQLFGVHGRSNIINGFGVTGLSKLHIGVRGISGDMEGGGGGVMGESETGFGVKGQCNTGPGVWGVALRNSGVLGTATSTEGVYGASRTGDGVHGYSDRGIGVFGHCRLPSGIVPAGSNIGVVGDSASGVGVGGMSKSNIGVLGFSANFFGVWGGSDNFTGVIGMAGRGGVQYPPDEEPIGVVGNSIAPINGIGVYGIARSAGWAGYFEGNVKITGRTELSGIFSKIDHPLDPDNKYLFHSSVESPDMKNIYDGMVALNDKGEAVIELPDWFGALNKDFRYQLTAIGAPGPNLYIAEEISDGVRNYSKRSSSNKKSSNRFKIAGGTSGMKVSWQVTGIRNDPYANAHPIQIEVNKSDKHRGYYIHPELYGESAEKAISHMLFATDIPIGRSHSPKQKREIPISD